MPQRTLDSIEAAKRFGRAKIEQGYQSVSMFRSGTPRSKGFRVVVRYADKE